jgi:hypothetical protein
VKGGKGGLVTAFPPWLAVFIAVVGLLVEAPILAKVESRARGRGRRDQHGSGRDEDG